MDNELADLRSMVKFYGSENSEQKFRKKAAMWIALSVLAIFVGSMYEGLSNQMRIIPFALYTIGGALMALGLIMLSSARATSIFRKYTDFAAIKERIRELET